MSIGAQPPLIDICSYTTSMSQRLIILIVHFIDIFIFMLSFFFYICFCIGDSFIETLTVIMKPEHKAQIGGLDAAQLEAFSTMMYWEVKGLSQVKIARVHGLPLWVWGWWYHSFPPHMQPRILPQLHRPVARLPLVSYAATISLLNWCRRSID